MTAEERNAQLRRLARDDDPGRERDPWDTDREIDVHEPSRRITGRVIAFVLLLLIVLGAAAGAVGFYARGAYYVGVDEGRVVIFKGRPGGLLWFSPTVEERTTLVAASLPEFVADDVDNGHEVASLADARAYVRNLEDEADPSSTTTTESPTTTTSTTSAAATPTSSP